MYSRIHTRLENGERPVLSSDANGDVTIHFGADDPSKASIMFTVHYAIVPWFLTEFTKAAGRAASKRAFNKGLRGCEPAPPATGD